jgi:hypothetical protein
VQTAGVIEGRNGACLALKALAELLVHDLDSDGPVQSRINRAINRTHAAAPEERDDFVHPEPIAARQLRHFLGFLDGVLVG